MRKSEEGFVCQECGVKFCDRMRKNRTRKFCSKSCSSKNLWTNYRSEMVSSLQCKKSPIFKTDKIICEFCGNEQTKRSANHRWCDLCVRPSSFKFDRSLLIKYGFSWREYEKMLIKQDYKCLICMQIPKRYNVDHCHKTGKIRGLLCSRCNGILEFIEDSERLRRALTYLGSV
jgi:hypothetical protein